MTSISHRILKSSMSAVTNCWKVALHGKTFAILPAHVAVYKQNYIWKRSHFMEGMNHLKWNLPGNYVTKQDFRDDFAWAEVDDPNDCLVLNTEVEVSHPIDSKFYFKQPYDHHGTFTTPTFGAMNAMVYSSPGGDLMLEAINTGFRGMSGALAYSNEIGIIGMFVGRGTPLGIDSKASVLYNDLQKYPPMTRAMILPCSLMSEHIAKGGVTLDSLVEG